MADPNTDFDRAGGVPGLKRLRELTQDPEEPYIYYRLFGRKVSLPITWVLLHTPVTPNQVTVAGILIGLGGAACLAGGTPCWQFAALGLLHLSAILDAVDGEVARYRRASSLDGYFVDACRHQLLVPAIFIALTVAVVSSHPDKTWLLVMGLISSALASRFVGGMKDQITLHGLERALTEGGRHAAWRNARTERAYRDAGEAGGAGGQLGSAHIESEVFEARSHRVPPELADPGRAGSGTWRGETRSSERGESRDRMPAVATPPAEPAGRKWNPAAAFVDFNLINILMLAVLIDVGATLSAGGSLAATPRPLAGGFTSVEWLFVAYGAGFPICKLGSMAWAWRTGVSGRVDGILRKAGLAEQDGKSSES